jgi:hypothetical protein
MMADQYKTFTGFTLKKVKRHARCHGQNKYRIERLRRLQLFI